jgi:SAM-dependent methyltransferase
LWEKGSKRSEPVPPVAQIALATHIDSMTDPAGRIVGHYEKHATAWDADRRGLGWNDRGWHDRFIEQLAVGASVLDLGCGGGQPVAAHLAERGMRVTGIDSSPILISLCRSRLPDHEWIATDMRTLALGRRFNGILAWDSFFHLDHDAQRGMFGVFAAHAASGAWLMFNTGTEHGESIGSYRGDPLYHASLASAEYETLIVQSGFEVIEHAIRDAHAGGRTVWLCRSRRERICGRMFSHEIRGPACGGDFSVFSEARSSPPGQAAL